MLFFAFSISLILRSSFDQHQTALFLGADKLLNNKKTYKENVVNNVANISSPACLAYYDGVNHHKFLHYDYVMFRSLWDEDTNFNDKVIIFNDICNWLKTFNQTIEAYFFDKEDSLAWNVATSNNENHFD